MTKESVVNFNSGEVTPEIDARDDLVKYPGGCRRSENMIPDLYGEAVKRPGTEFVATGGASPTNIEVRAKLDFVAHAQGGIIASVTDGTTLLFQDLDTDAVTLMCDIDQRGFSVFNLYMVADIDSYSPLILYDPDGVDTGTDFEFGTALGDSRKSVSANRDVRFSPSGDHIYMLSWGIGKLRIHKYDRTGTRIWRADFDKQFSEWCGAFTIDKDENIYVGFGSGLTGKQPLKISSVDGSITRTYSLPELRLAFYAASCVSDTLDIAYFGGRALAGSNPSHTAAYGISFDSDTTITYTDTGATVRWMISNGPSLFIAGIDGSFTANSIIKLNGSTLAVEDQVNIADVSGLWIDFDGNLGVAIDDAGDSIITLDPDDLSSTLSDTTVVGNWCSSTGLGYSRREEYRDWPTANEVVMFASEHGFTTGESKTVSEVQGMIELNGNTYDITVIDDNYFSLDGTDSTEFSEYTGGGIVR